MQTLKNKKGQGTTEYILVIGIAVAIAVGVLWTKLRQPLNDQVTTITTEIGQVGK